MSRAHLPGVPVAELRYPAAGQREATDDQGEQQVHAASQLGPGHPLTLDLLLCRAPAG